MKIAMLIIVGLMASFAFATLIGKMIARGQQ